MSSRPGARWWPWLLSACLLAPLLAAGLWWRAELVLLARIVVLELRRIVS